VTCLRLGRNVIAIIDLQAPTRSALTGTAKGGVWRDPLQREWQENVCGHVHI